MSRRIRPGWWSFVLAAAGALLARRACRTSPLIPGSAAWYALEAADYHAAEAERQRRIARHLLGRRVA